MRFKQHILQAILALLVAGTLVACAAGENGEGNSGKVKPVSSPGAVSQPKRLILVSADASDSASLATAATLDAMLDQAFEDFPDQTYITLEEQAEVQNAAGDSVVQVADLATSLDADAVIALHVARFGSVVGVDMRVFDAATNQPLFQDRAFSFIRYRTSDDTKLFGPALYEALQRLVYRLNGHPDTEHLFVSAQPLIISSVVIDRDPRLGKIASTREAISTDGVRAMGDFMRAKYPELVVFDLESRSRVYEMVGVALVEDHAAVSDLERDAMFRLDLPYYLTTSIRSAPGDSVDIQAEIRYVTGPRSDTLVDSASRRSALSSLETSTLVKDVVTQILEVADIVAERQADRLIDEYAKSLDTR